MDKKALILKIIEKLESDRTGLANAAKNTYEAATHEESVPEDQYDTRGLEASYLAGAQAKRVADLEQLILSLRFLQPKTFTDKDAITSTALVELDHEGKTSWCFLLPSGGGMTVNFEGHSVQIITPQSPIGEALIGRKVGDEAVVDTGRETRDYEIVSVR